MRWQLQPATVGLVGYRFQYVDQNSDDPLGYTVINPNTLIPISPSVRNRMSHFLFVGVDHDFNVKHSVMGRVGVEYAMYPDAIDALGMRDDAWAPYVDAMYQYLLTEDSRVQVGIKSEMYQTDVALATLGGGAPTQDAWSSTAYAAFTYEITPRLIGMVRGLAQWSQFNGGIADDD